MLKSKLGKILLLLIVQGGHPMSDFQKVIKLISFEDPKYFSITEKEILELSFEKVSEYKFDGIIISSPKQIDILKENSFPVICASSFSMRHIAMINEEKNMLALAYGSRNSFYIGPAMYRSKIPLDLNKEDKEDSLPSSHLEDGKIVGCKRYNIKESLRIPWIPETYHITFIYYDKISNTVETKLLNNFFEEKKDIKENLTSPPKIDCVVDVIEESKNCKNMLTFKLPEKVKIKNIIKMKGEIDITSNSYNLLIRENNITIWKPLSLLLIEKDVGHKPILKIDVIVGAKINFSEKRSNIASSKDLIRFFGTFEVDISNIHPDYFENKTRYCCYLACYEKIEGPVFMEIVD